MGRFLAKDGRVQSAISPNHATAIAEHVGAPVDAPLEPWMYTNVSNSLYLYWRANGTSDVMVYAKAYGYTSWYGYATNSWSGSCMTKSTQRRNSTRTEQELSPPGLLRHQVDFRRIHLAGGGTMA
jgi:hypothetical protein